MNNYHIIIYNKDEMYYTEGELTSMEVVPSIIDNPYGGVVAKRPYIKTYTTCEYEPTEYIKLDDTTMKRILKYNKETEIKKLDKIIEKKKEEIKELESKMEDRKQRTKKVEKYIKDIYELDLNNNDDDDDDYYDEY